MARAAAVLDDVCGGAAERGRSGDIFSPVTDPRASFVACGATSDEMGVLRNVARCSCTSSRVATQLLLDGVIKGCTAGAQHASTCTRPCVTAARGRPRHLSGAIADARRTVCSLGRRGAARLRCPPRKAPPAWVRHRGRSSRGRDSWRSRRGSRPEHRGKPPGGREPSAAAAFDLSRTSVPGRPGAGHIEGPEAATAARLQVMSASCWRRILHHRCRGEAQPAGGLVRRPRGGCEVRSRLHGGRGGTFGTEGGSPGRRGGP